MSKKLRGLHGTMTFKRGVTLSEAVDYAERRLGCRVESAGRDGRKVQIAVRVPLAVTDRFARCNVARHFAFEQGGVS